jgi:hypothetical protein
LASLADVGWDNAHHEGFQDVISITEINEVHEPLFVKAMGSALLKSDLPVTLVQEFMEIKEQRPRLQIINVKACRCSIDA